MARNSQQTRIQYGSGSPIDWADVEECVSIQGPNAQSNDIECTHLRSTEKEYLQGLPDNGEVTLTCNYKNGTVQMALRTLFKTQADPVPFRILRPTAAGASTYDAFQFNASVKSWQFTNTQVDSKQEIQIVLKVSGAETFDDAMTP